MHVFFDPTKIFQRQQLPVLGHRHKYKYLKSVLKIQLKYNYKYQLQVCTWWNKLQKVYWALHFHTVHFANFAWHLPLYNHHEKISRVCKKNNQKKNKSSSEWANVCDWHNKTIQSLCRKLIHDHKVWMFNYKTTKWGVTYVHFICSKWICLPCWRRTPTWLHNKITFARNNFFQEVLIDLENFNWKIRTKVRYQMQFGWRWRIWWINFAT